MARGLTDQSSYTIPKADNLFYRGSIKSEAPPYSPHRHNTVAGDNVGYRIEDTKKGKNLFYAPGLGVIEDHVLEYMKNADVVLIDGTVWTDDEMSRHGINNKKASEMGHLDQSSKGGIMETLSSLHKPRKILIHINNTNPILREDSEERKLLESNEIEVSYDGMDIIL